MPGSMPGFATMDAGEDALEEVVEKAGPFGAKPLTKA
jgi:hypothetical protein